VSISYLSISLVLLVLAGFYSIEDVVVAIITVALFAVQKPSFVISNEIGKISYSLYLTHGLFGGWLLFFLSRDDYVNWSPYLIIPLAIVFSLLGAKLFYHLFEKPSMWLAKKIKYVNLVD
jgi:peptidoglycan/LPS O-acetylase OafA/YrhL